MACGQLCAWNFEGNACLRPIDEICPMTNIASQGKIQTNARPQTNAEWMRNMTDKELVEFIGHCSLCDRVQGEVGNWCNDHNCTDCLQEWLKQPAGEGDGNG